MTDLSSIRRKSWKPPKRPDWVAQINTEGSNMDIKSIIPLDEHSLLSAAKANTGLADFGEDDWYEPFKVFIRSLDEEAELTLMGRLMTRSDLLLFLEARLRIEDTYKKHPEIEEEEIIKPLLILGQGRSGTTVLQNVLSTDPNHGTLKIWEVMFPCPPPEKATYLTDPRVKKADKFMDLWNRVTPELVSVHEFCGDIPVESIYVEALSFVSPEWLNLLGQVPSYNAYVAQRSFEPAYRYEKRVLKLLQWRNPRKHWILKAPSYALHLPDVLRVYPDACFVWIHRDPIKALASMVSAIGTLNWARSDRPLVPGAYEHWTRSDLVGAMLCLPIDWLENKILPHNQLCNIQYLDFTRDPMAVIERIYAYFAIRLTEEGRAAMLRYMNDNPRTGRPAHEYDVGSEELIGWERQVFKRYQDYFNVPSEI